MLSICSATHRCSSHSQISFLGSPLSICPYQKDAYFRSFQEDRILPLPSSLNVYHRRRVSQAAKSVYSIVERNSSVAFSESSSYLDNTKCSFHRYNLSAADGDSSLLSATASFDDFVTRIQDSIGASVNTGENVVTSSLNSINSSLTSITETASEAVDNVWSKVFSNIDQTGEFAGIRLSGLLNDSKDATARLTGVSADVLRRTIVIVEDSIVKGTYFVVDYYGSAKELLPSEIRDAVNVTEERVGQILRPVGTTLHEVSTAIGVLEKRFGLDPEDPVIQFVLSLGSLGALWAFYWIWTYAGYAGELSPEATLDLLKSEKKAMLIDVRPEVLRERDGVPDLRRATRSRYASVTLPEVDSSVRKLLRSGKEIEDSLIAAVIRNLKAVQDRSNVIIMDADGTASKGIARSLSKLGVKASFPLISLDLSRIHMVEDTQIELLRNHDDVDRTCPRSYLVKGGFNSWVKHDLRIKELKPETTLTVLNEALFLQCLSQEAEAILEGVSSLQLIGYGVGLLAASYALLEWEKSLQLIGVVGLVLTIYLRLATYETPEDLTEDVSLLLVPVKMGSKAISWAAEKLETNGNGLPTSPSSSDVQNRVLQAAAKHESQPSSETEGTQPPMNENADLSEA
ncbi:Calcium sensing receptor, chloroplastic [Linum perenne]